ncbi:MAG: hypothetical protein L7T25_01020, partial [Gammaproteobacteria bacterium]|nr:hypothetical protein [Gammaproteobacteria bacterium]
LFIHNVRILTLVKEISKKDVLTPPIGKFLENWPTKETNIEDKNDNTGVRKNSRRCWARCNRVNPVR